MPKKSHCPLCAADQLQPYHEDKKRRYLSCERCHLVFVPEEFHLDAAAEKAEYDKHENVVGDLGYQGFLARLCDPLLALLPAHSHGLDFGCGPGPALAAMLELAGHRVDLFDIFYAPQEAALARKYDFITATEVVEHLRHPGFELEGLWACLRPGGYLGVMTKLVIDKSSFAQWHYKNDPTHIAFFSRASWRWWAQAHGAALTFHGTDVVILGKSD